MKIKMLAWMGIKLSGAQKGKYAVTSILLFSPFTLPPDEINILKAFGGGQRVHNVVYFLVNQPPLHPYHRHDSHAHYKFPNRILSPLSPLPLFTLPSTLLPSPFQVVRQKKVTHQKHTTLRNIYFNLEAPCPLQLNGLYHMVGWTHHYCMDVDIFPLLNSNVDQPSL